MPHITMEYSANLDGRVDMHEFCRTVLKAALSTGVFETAAVRVRALPADAYAIADDDERNAFIHIAMRLAPGRDPATKKRVGDTIFQAATAKLGDLVGSPHFALSLELHETDPELSWKANGMHARLRSKA
jgi:5-carboxymethyl-2-hydroxymuconate isomerase